MTPPVPSPPDGGVAALDRAVAVLNAFRPGDGALPLAELASRSGLYKSTILRLAASLIRADLLERLEDGRYRIGPTALRWGSLYQRSVAPADVLLPMMRLLAGRSGESIAFYTRTSDDTRTCLYRVESERALRYHVQEGDRLPLGAGSGGRVLAAFSGEAGEPYDTIRRTLHYVSHGERDPDIAGLSAPIFGVGDRLMGALTIAGPRSRLGAAALAGLRAPLLDAAAAITRAFGGDAARFEPWKGPHAE